MKIAIEFENDTPKNIVIDGESLSIGAAQEKVKILRKEADDIDRVIRMCQPRKKKAAFVGTGPRADKKEKI